MEIHAESLSLSKEGWDAVHDDDATWAEAFGIAIGPYFEDFAVNVHFEGWLLVIGHTASGRWR